MSRVLYARDMMGDGAESIDGDNESDLARCFPLDTEAWDFGWERVDGATVSSWELFSSPDDGILSAAAAFSDDRPCAWRLVVGICVLMDSLPNERVGADMRYRLFES
jgi:hypothetical protein